MRRSPLHRKKRLNKPSKRKRQVEEKVMANSVQSSPDFSLDVDGVKGLCPAGEAWAKQNMVERKIPVFSCEGPCIRGEIARLAANRVAEEEPYARACHAETFTVPYSSMARWVKDADRVVMIDGCFLKCHGRILKHLIDEERMVHIDALPLHKKYGDVFLMDDVPETERKAVAREVADKILTGLKIGSTAQSG
jgi:uncharacterized metal-binding protein